ncbi:hypothetical protein [Xanthomonas campestris]|uniref:hypothetical protein n=1 Tax=Xanthomonas campestris TaxID=339 RepID=UPI0035566FC5
MHGSAAFIATFLWLSITGAAFSAPQTQQADPDTAWPPGRQHLLAGHYVGKLHPDIAPCQAVRAELWLEAAQGDKSSRRYTLKTTCIAPESQRSNSVVTERGPWWLDIVGSECLMLSREDASDLSLNPNLYGFRITTEPTASDQKPSYSLAQDGHNCHSGDWPEHRDKVLKRVR